MPGIPFNTIATPKFWGVDWRSDIPYYYVTLGVAAFCYFAVQYVSRAPFGLALQGVRDNPRRMAALGFNVNAHRVAAYAFASFIAALGGVLQVWNYRQISPGSVSVGACIDILIIAVVGGITRPIGPFIGAFTFVILRTFALDLLVKFGLDGNRFRLLIGLGFLAISYGYQRFDTTVMLATIVVLVALVAGVQLLGDACVRAATPYAPRSPRARRQFVTV